jgi:hypothetical protein
MVILDGLHSFLCNNLYLLISICNDYRVIIKNSVIWLRWNSHQTTAYCRNQTAVTEMKDACVATSIVILSCPTSSLRIFLGLSHVRHLSTVREHLSSLVQSTVAGDDDVTRQGLTREKWSELYQDGKVHLSYILTCSEWYLKCEDPVLLWLTLGDKRGGGGGGGSVPHYFAVPER